MAVVENAQSESTTSVKSCRQRHCGGRRVWSRHVVVEKSDGATEGARDAGEG